MKKTLVLILAMLMILTLCACSVQENSVAGVAVEQGIIIAARALESLVLIFGTWVLSKIGKKKGFENFALALDNLIRITQQTVDELQQTLVDGWKEAGGGKLTEAQIYKLSQELHLIVLKKLDTSTKELIEAAGCDMSALIQGIAESYINMIKAYSGS